MFRFRVELTNAPAVETNAGSFMACYDKKFIWRSNLYISEGAADWNNLNPWTAAQGNEWDTTGNGGQCVINPWTMYTNPNAPYFSNGGDVFDAVAYTFGGCDAVRDFNLELVAQADAAGRPAVDANRTLASTDPVRDDNNYWENYLKTSYVPSYSYIRRKQAGAETEAEQLQSSGVDCGGFLMRVASYQVNGTKAYLVGAPNDNERDEMGVNRLLRYYPPIFSDDTTINNYIWNVDLDELNLLIPGDIIWLRNKLADNSYEYHVVVINKMLFDVDSRNVIAGNIKLIDATTYLNKLNVQKTQSYVNYSGWSTIKPGRLIYNN
jgi:hypothetical protein